MMNRISLTLNRILFSLLLIVIGLGPVCAVEDTRNGVTYNVVYLRSGSNGTGDSTTSPVGTWTDAYKKLVNTGDRDYDWEHNIIVIVGETGMQLNYKESETKDMSNVQGTAATITGVWPWDANGNATATAIKGGGRAKIVGTTNNIGADVRFKNLRIQGDGTVQDRLSLRLHSTTFDTGLIMMGFNSLTTGFGMIADRPAPAFHIQFSFDHFGSSRASDVVYKMPEGKEMTVTFRSGKYGRVALSRTQGTTAALVKSCYIQGTPNQPIMAHVVMDIQPDNDNTGNYADDISIFLGGSSQGLVCADLKCDIKHGTIGTLVAGTQGNNIQACHLTRPDQGLPPDATFAGRTVMNIGNEGGADDDVVIQTYYGGTQGRATQTNYVARSFFYGESEYNMYSGTVKAGVFASATAFSGLRYENDHSIHTPDDAIPYVDGSNNLTFFGYDENKTMATIKSSYQGDVDLSTTKLTFNIHGGVIEGGLYGGSRGYAEEIKVGVAPDWCGTHFGNTFVNVYGGTIKGGVYGGGLGTKEYYNQNAKDGFLTVAQVYGNTHVNIYGGDIEGNIYGGGYGIATDKNEYIDIAHVYGTTNVTIEPIDPNWTFTGNIYGGGALGAVNGETHVVIKGGIINGNVFGGGKGEDGHPNKAKVTGTAHVLFGEN